MDTRYVLFALILISSIQRAPLVRAATPVERYLATVRELRSYDVVLQVGYVEYPDARELKKAENTPRIGPLAETVRDVFAVDRGRRFERSIDVPEVHSISVKDWQAVVSGPKPPGVNLSYGAPGLNYFNYFNPNCDGFLLADWIRKSDSVVRAAVFADGPQLPSFELTHSLLRGPIRFWLDPGRGYLPVRIARYFQKDGSSVIWSAIDVHDFAQVSEHIWVPVSCTQTDYIPAGPLAGRATSGFRITVDVNRSSWNSIHSDDLFLAENVDSINDEWFGWNRSLSDPELATVKATVGVIDAAQPRDGGYSTFLLAAIIGLLVLVFIVILRKLPRRMRTG